MEHTPPMIFKAVKNEAELEGMKNSTVILYDAEQPTWDEKSW